MGDRLSGKRVLVTSADKYMGPAIIELFQNEGATVFANEEKLDQAAVDKLVNEVGQIDVLVANFAVQAPMSTIQTMTDENWDLPFEELVHPLMRIVRALVPQMIERKQGKIVAITSVAPLSGFPYGSAYASARSAQNTFIRSVGLELAAENIQANIIAQGYVKNPTYFPDALVETEKFMKHVERNVPVKRMAEGWETAELALFLASENSNFIVGQIIPFAGGATTSTG